MKFHLQTIPILLSFFLQIGFNPIGIAQKYEIAEDKSSLIIEGTSNIHDWQLEATDFKGTIKLQFENEELTKIPILQFSLRSESLQSGKSGLDRNAYKALKTEKYKWISYTISELISSEQLTENTYKVSVRGDLEVTGISKPVILELEMECKENELILETRHEMKISDYNIDPPKALFGAIHTADDILIKVRAHYAQNVQQ